MVSLLKTVSMLESPKLLLYRTIEV